MIIEIILINFFKKYYMNKNLKNTLITNFPVISIIILGLIYFYLNAPDNTLEQKGGGEKTFAYPPNTPFLYKYRFAFVALPFLLLLLIAYYAYFTYVTVATLTPWNFGHDFFSNFQKQHAIATKKKITPIDYTYSVSEDMKEKQPELAKFFNMIQLTGNPLSGLYIKGQYFCSVARPCNCCLDSNYRKYFFECGTSTPSNTPCENNDSYRRTCLPSAKMPAAVTKISPSR